MSFGEGICVLFVLIAFGIGAVVGIVHGNTNVLIAALILGGGAAAYGLMKVSEDWPNIIKVPIWLICAPVAFGALLASPFLLFMPMAQGF